MKRVLVIEDGDEYVDFARAMLAAVVICDVAQSGRDALAKAADADAFLLDLRFERVEPTLLLGDPEEVATGLFGGERTRALRHLQDQQGTYILRALREAGHHQRAVFVHDFSPRWLENLRALYGDVAAVPGFDAAALRTLLGGS